MAGTSRFGLWPEFIGAGLGRIGSSIWSNPWSRSAALGAGIGASYGAGSRRTSILEGAVSGAGIGIGLRAGARGARSMLPTYDYGRLMGMGRGTSSFWCV